MNVHNHKIELEHRGKKIDKNSEKVPDFSRVRQTIICKATDDNGGERRAGVGGLDPPADLVVPSSQQIRPFRPGFGINVVEEGFLEIK